MVQFKPGSPYFSTIRPWCLKNLFYDFWSRLVSKLCCLRESVYEVNFGCANSRISHQLRYINTISRIAGNVAVHMRKVDNPECKVYSLIVDADTERCMVFEEQRPNKTIFDLKSFA